MQTNPKPNIILINADDLGYGDLGCYGSTLNQTPQIDALANSGKRFTDFYVGSPVCSASRAALMTGCYPQRIGFGHHSVLFPGENVGLDPHETTIASQLKQSGYTTKIIGKWHCGDQPAFLPTNHGFDRYFGIPYSNDMGLQQGKPKEKYGPLPLMRDEVVIQQQPDQHGLTERYTEEALQFIDQNLDKPFFLYLAHLYVHVPLFVPPTFLRKSRNGVYGGAVECLDWSTGMIVDWLEHRGLRENTLIIFTSDNGACGMPLAASNAPCRGTKGTTWEGGQRVPCIMSWPGRIEAGSTASGVVRAMDLLPTLSRLAGLEEPPPLEIDGVDLTDYILGANPDCPNDTFYYYNHHDLEAVRVGDWKLHFKKRRRPARKNLGSESVQELYHVREDIGEACNLYRKHPDIVERLSRIGEAARERLGDASEDRAGRDCRPIGQVQDARQLTTYREDYPYIVAEYDWNEAVSGWDPKYFA